ncbi:hypothetical protein DPMN_097868 [Dreissena polymorpha]|uniref:DDE-1 domain-containing protein n=1 Tax=Dreissena polymorpha TaxID=45954 RepID=A0A9D4R642_DREPO|nr:hypothetical protein DPMN_097868 [Dreissena polymorpha]
MMECPFSEHPGLMPGRCESKILLLLDGHRSHVSFILAEWAKENGIILYVLPAHTSHLLQPLDVACYVNDVRGRDLTFICQNGGHCKHVVKNTVVMD